MASGQSGAAGFFVTRACMWIYYMSTNDRGGVDDYDKGGAHFATCMAYSVVGMQRQARGQAQVA